MLQKVLWLFASFRAIEYDTVLTPPSPPTVKVLNGTYFGVLDGLGQDLFLGAPYTNPPGRFQKAESLSETWSGARDATVYGFDCPA